MADTIPVIWGQTSDGKDAYVKTCTAGVYNPATRKTLDEEMVTMQDSPAAITGETPIKPVCDASGNVICPQTRTEAVYDPESGQTLDKVIHPVYSTEEQWTGEYWIDGKKIYRKVLTGNGNGSASINVSVEGVDTLVEMSGFFSDSAGANPGLPINAYGNSSLYAFTYFSRGSNRITISINGWKIYKYNLLVKYTKATE